MCGRYVSTKPDDELAGLYGATVVGPGSRPSWNTAPTQDVQVVLERGDAEGSAERMVRSVRWGLVPSWSRKGPSGRPLINARVETAAEKPSFRAAFARRRAIVPADGYYEWTPEPAGDGKIRKQPFYIYPEDDAVLSMAGLYELWPDPGRAEDDPQRWLWSVTIITTDASGPAGEIHDRTPLMLPADRIDAWLDPSITDSDRVQSILRGIEPLAMHVREVSKAVNRVTENRPELIAGNGGADRPLQLSLA